jgi:HD-like signal output (HDOD) protein
VPDITDMNVPPSLREKLLDIVQTMPASPGILAQLGNLLIDLNCDLESIVAMLKRDAALTTRIIRISNSALYNTGEPYASLEAALARVGLTEVYRLAGFAAVTQMTDERFHFYGIAAVRLRENSLLSALMMEQLADPARLDPRMAYTAGLLRSMGKIALERLTTEVLPECGGLADWEKTVAGIDNCEAAAVVLQQWRFPLDIVEGIRDHYLIEPGGGRLAHLLNLAAGAAERSGHGLPGEGLYWEITPEKLAVAQVEDREVEEALARARSVFEEVRAAVA